MLPFTGASPVGTGLKGLILVLLGAGLVFGARGQYPRIPWRRNSRVCVADFR
jgi:hypothetical protein